MGFCISLGTFSKKPYRHRCFRNWFLFVRGSQACEPVPVGSWLVGVILGHVGLISCTSLCHGVGVISFVLGCERSNASHQFTIHSGGDASFGSTSISIYSDETFSLSKFSKSSWRSISDWFDASATLTNRKKIWVMGWGLGGALTNTKIFAIVKGVRRNQKELWKMRCQQLKCILIFIHNLIFSCILSCYIVYLPHHWSHHDLMWPAWEFPPTNHGGWLLTKVLRQMRYRCWCGKVGNEGFQKRSRWDESIESKSNELI